MVSRPAQQARPDTPAMDKDSSARLQRDALDDSNTFCAQPPLQQNINMSRSSDYVKSVKKELIQYSARTWTGHQLPVNAPVSNLTELCSFEVDGVSDSNAQWFSGEGDLEEVLQVMDRKKEIEEQRTANLKGMISQDKEVSRKVSSALNDDLMCMGRSDLLGANPMTKAQAVTHYQVTNHLMTVDRNTDTEFEVTLIKLANGHGANVLFETFYFPYQDKHPSWPILLETLQRATKDSKIPPRDLYDFHFWEKTAASTNIPSLISSKAEGSRAEDGLAVKTPGLHMQFKSTFIGTNLPDPSAPGYTLAHGPWIYRFMTDNEHSKRRESCRGFEYKQLATYDDYTEMKSNFKAMVKSNPQQNFQIQVVHSMDRAAQNQAKEIKQLEILSEDSWKRGARADGFDEEDLGVPYMEHMDRQYRMERQQSQSHPNSPATSYQGSPMPAFSQPPSRPASIKLMSSAQFFSSPLNPGSGSSSGLPIGSASNDSPASSSIPSMGITSTTGHGPINDTSLGIGYDSVTTDALATGAGSLPISHDFSPQHRVVHAMQNDRAQSPTAAHSHEFVQSIQSLPSAPIPTAPVPTVSRQKAPSPQSLSGSVAQTRSYRQILPSPPSPVPTALPGAVTAPRTNNFVQHPTTSFQSPNSDAHGYTPAEQMVFSRTGPSTPRKPSFSNPNSTYETATPRALRSQNRGDLNMSPGRGIGGIAVQGNVDIPVMPKKASTAAVKKTPVKKTPSSGGVVKEKRRPRAQLPKSK